MLEVKKIAVGSSFTLKKFDQKYRNSITISSMDYKQEYFESYVLFFKAKNGFCRLSLKNTLVHNNLNLQLPRSDC